MKARRRVLDPDSFLALMEVVEDAGGVHLTEACVGRKYKQAKHPGQRKETRFTTRCNKPARFLIPYIGEQDQDSTLIACANDDWIDAWPRFIETKEVEHASTSDA